MAVTQNKFVSPQAIKTANCVTDTASTDIDDSPTTSVLLATAGANGAKLVGLASIPRATVTATMLGLYISKDAGTTKRLIRSRLMAAHTVANTTEIPLTDWGFSDDSPLWLEAGDRLYMTQAVSLAGGIVHNAQIHEY